MEKVIKPHAVEEAKGQSMKEPGDHNDVKNPPVIKDDKRQDKKSEPGAGK